MESIKKCDPPRSADGERWLKAYLHPPSGLEGVQGIPDHSVQSSTTLNFRMEFSVDAPLGVGTGTWSCLLINLPNPQYPLLVLKWPGDLPIVAGDVSVSTPLNPNFVWGTDAANWNANVARYRIYAASTTAYFDAASLYDQGKCYVAQSSFADNFYSEATAATPLRQTIGIGKYPVEASVLMQLSDRYYTGMAKEGSYSPEGFANPTMEYKSGTSIRTNVTGTVALSSGASFSLVTPLGGVAASVVPTFESYTQSYHLYKGLLNQATLQVKRVIGLEILPVPGSAWAPFSTAGPCPDFPALEAAACQRHLGRDGYPSSSNDLGGFMQSAKALGPVLSAVWKMARPAVKLGVGTLPGGGLMNSVIDGVEGIMRRKVTNGPQTTDEMLEQLVQNRMKGLGGGKKKQTQKTAGTPASLTKAQRKRRNAKNRAAQV